MENLFEGKHEISDEEVYQAQNEQNNIWEQEIDGKTTIVLAPTYRSPYPALEKAAKALASRTEPMYTLGINKRGQEFYKSTKLSKPVAHMDQFTALYNPAIFYSPYIQLFFDSVEKHCMWSERCVPPGATLDATEKDRAERWNNFVESMQRGARTEEFKRRVIRRQENSTHKLKSARIYVNQIFDSQSRLEILRVDLEYQTDLDSPVTLSQARKDLKHFLDNRRTNKLFDDLKGYIWTLEFGGRGRGYHFHMLFFFAGSRVQGDTYRARQIGEYWVKTITKGRGAYHNSNRDKAIFSRLNRLGIGRIEHHQWDLRKNLDYIIQYMTKKDSCLFPEYDGGKSYSKGGPPPLNTTGVGRPRKARPQIRLVNSN